MLFVAEDGLADVDSVGRHGIQADARARKSSTKGTAAAERLWYDILHSVVTLQ